MKTIVKFIIVSVLVGVLTSGKLAAQSDNVYWFYINVILSEDAKTGYVSYKIKPLGKRIYHAKIKEYDKILWKNLSIGQKFAVGPFEDYEEAKQALIFYGYKKKKLQLDTTYNTERNIHWFMLRVERRPRSGAYKLERIPGAIGQGTYEIFYDNYKAGLSSKTLPIGPFWNMEEAEEAKRRYRLH